MMPLNNNISIIINDLKKYDYCFITSWFFNGVKDYDLLFIWAVFNEFSQVNIKAQEELLRILRLKWWHDQLEKTLNSTNPTHHNNTPLLLLAREVKNKDKCLKIIKSICRLYELLAAAEIELIEFERQLDESFTLTASLFSINVTCKDIIQNYWLTLHADRLSSYLEIKNITITSLIQDSLLQYSNLLPNEGFAKYYLATICYHLNYIAKNSLTIPAFNIKLRILLAACKQKLR
ncbi:hypothetical protein [Rickettsiales endosymbiont of Stachyamoeba lipophora]|uniref:hypothetical protein n=1 Tax=Rickettsiales endosymbiont of Stachyamoeba lipophora TaxID=2486578 RepID=UPI000F654BB4|nr:hypothetical protein [Rickettsiales endosymbiont of Stachyamoeba lipophora]AZL14996.1 hypothetical protein EF513_00220 [Rickettsiales endosymbiont of Stachyamoeba lipophora]